MGRATVQRRLQPLVHEGVADAGDGRQADAERRADLLVRPTRAARACVRLQQHPGMGERPRRAAARRYEGMQRDTLFLRQCDSELRPDDSLGWVDDTDEFHAREHTAPCQPRHIRCGGPLGHAVSLHFMWYNFGRVHQTLKTTPAMAAGVADHRWTTEEIAGLL